MTSSFTSEKEVTNIDEGQEDEVEITSSSSLIGSLIGGLKTMAAGIFGSANFLLSLFSSRGELKSVENKNGKRKRSGDGDMDDEVDDDDEQEEEMEMKRWRPDKVYEAIQYFVSNLLGEKDSNENMKAGCQDENKNTTQGDPNWSPRPNINFFSDSLISSIEDIEGDGRIKKTSTPQIFLEENQIPDVFVFSAEKNNVKKDVEDDNSLSQSTFEQKQAYFMDQIKIQESKAQETERRSPSPAPRIITTN